MRSARKSVAQNVTQNRWNISSHHKGGDEIKGKGVIIIHNIKRIRYNKHKPTCNIHRYIPNTSIAMQKERRKKGNKK
jgi:hypothetical protein